MAPKRRNPSSDSLAANPKQCSLYTNYFLLIPFVKEIKQVFGPITKAYRKCSPVLILKIFARGTRNCRMLNSMQMQICTQQKVVYFMLTVLFILTPFSPQSLHYWISGSCLFDWNDRWRHKRFWHRRYWVPCLFLFSCCRIVAESSYIHYGTVKRACDKRWTNFTTIFSPFGLLGQGRCNHESGNTNYSRIEFYLTCGSLGPQQANFVKNVTWYRFGWKECNTSGSVQ